MLEAIAEKFAGEKLSTLDGVKIDFDEGWVHLRKSNTEPIIRIYAEGKSREQADLIAQRFLNEMNVASTQDRIG